MELHGAIYTFHMSCDVPPTKQQCGHGADLFNLSEDRINKHLTGVKAQVTGHRWCESTNAGCMLLGTLYSM